MPHIDVFGASHTQYPEELVDRFLGKRLVVVGGARCVWDDLKQLGIRGGAENNGYDIMCINDIIMHYPGRVRHFFSNDHRWTPKWLDARREFITRDFGNVDYIHTCGVGGRYCWPWPGNGTSALGATYTGIALGYSPIVLCGIPLDNGPHYFEPPWITTNFNNEVPEYNAQMKYWGKAKETIFNGKVKSCSGRTRELLGSPT